MKFTKPARDLADQVALLRSKGLEIPDAQAAKQLLENVGYYRLSAYTHPFRDSQAPDQFKAGTTLAQVVRLYDFDRKLRFLVNDALERIEISLRSRIVNATCLHFHDPHWFMDPAKFHRRYHHRGFLEKVEAGLSVSYDHGTKQKVLPTQHPETFIEHYYQKYGDPYLPPFWMTAETLTLGTLSRFYKGIHDHALKNTVAQPFGVPTKVFISWFHALTHLRNVCAHHGRLWNRVFSITPLVTKKHQGIISGPKRFNAFAVVIAEMLSVSAPDLSWKNEFRQLMDEYPEIDPAAMGFQPDWKKDPFWQ